MEVRQDGSVVLRWEQVSYRKHDYFADNNHVTPKARYLVRKHKRGDGVGWEVLLDGKRLEGEVPTVLAAQLAAERHAGRALVAGINVSLDTRRLLAALANALEDTLEQAERVAVRIQDAVNGTDLVLPAQEAVLALNKARSMPEVVALCSALRRAHVGGQP